MTIKKYEFKTYAEFKTIILHFLHIIKDFDIDFIQSFYTYYYDTVITIFKLSF